jgi:translation initiation factor 2 gamma subunit (eIF-2gamma)
MHVVDAVAIAAGEDRRIGATPGGMAGIEQQVDGLACRADESVDIGL